MTRKYRDRQRATLAGVREIRRIAQAIEEKGEADNTVFVILSDNGYHLGSHRLSSGKQTPYRTDHEVPLAVWGKIGGQPILNTNRPHIVQNTDLRPTFMELAGGDPSGHDGKSFAPVVDPTRAMPPRYYRDEVIWEGYYGADVPSAIVPPTYSAIVNRYGKKFVRYHHPDRADEYEYYDWRRDPHEAENGYKSLSLDKRREWNVRRDELFRCEEASC